MGNSSGSRANNVYSPGSDKFPDVQLYMSTSCQLGIREIRAFSDIEKPLLYSDLAVKAVKSENKKKGFSTSENARISSRLYKNIVTAAGRIATSLFSCDITILHFPYSHKLEMELSVKKKSEI